MAIIKPFKGYCPNSEIAKYVSSPPYDVMSSNEARDMIKNNPDSMSWGYGDSLDRERVRDIILEKYNLSFS